MFDLTRNKETCEWMYSIVLFEVLYPGNIHFASVQYYLTSVFNCLYLFELAK